MLGRGLAQRSALRRGLLAASHLAGAQLRHGSWKPRGPPPPRDSRGGAASGRHWEQRGGRGRGGGGSGGGGGGGRGRPSDRDAAPRQGNGSWGDEQADEDGEFLYPARPSKASFREQLAGEALYGVAPILAALTAGSRMPHALLVQEGTSAAQRKDGRAFGDIQRLAAAASLPLRSVSKHELNMLAGNRPHQGLVLDASPLQWSPLDQLPDLGEAQAQGGSHPVWLALDEVMDPQNLGAMLRSAYCLGAAGVLSCSRNCAPLSPVVSKASAGAAELMALHSCKSMPRTLSNAAERGWAVVGAAAEAGAVPASSLRVEQPTVLVMGNEGYGLRPIVKRCCTQLVQIEMSPGGSSGSSSSSSNRGRQQLVDSLNVSVATGILLHQLLAAAARQC